MVPYSVRVNFFAYMVLEQRSCDCWKQPKKYETTSLVEVPNSVAKPWNQEAKVRLNLPIALWV